MPDPELLELPIRWILSSREEVGRCVEPTWVRFAICRHPCRSRSQHLRIMRDRGAVALRREGQKVYYRVANPKFIEGYKLIREGIREQKHLETERLSESVGPHAERGKEA
jgi:hypothetical protein